jgi:hypothetical protein
MLNPRTFGLAGGILWGLVMFVFTIIAVYTGYSEQFLNLMSSIYLGYSVSLWGSIVGLVYGFFDAFIGLYIFARLYNALSHS